MGLADPQEAVRSPTLTYIINTEHKNAKYLPGHNRRLSSRYRHFLT